MKNKWFIACFAHTENLFPLEKNDVLVGKNQKQLDNDLFLPVSNTGLQQDTFSDYAMLFRLMEAFDSEEIESVEWVYLTYYRRFVSGTMLGENSTSAPYLKVFEQSNRNLLATSLRDEISQYVEQESFMIGPRLKFKSIADNYSRHHLADDFSTFLVSLSRCSGWSSARVSSFARCQYLIPAPNNGLYSLSFLKEAVAILVEVSNDYLKNFYEPREGYQRRVMGFLLERLHSYLIIEFILKSKQKHAFLNSFVISEGDYKRTE